MKKSLILSAILVLALSVSAAAEVGVSGRVRFFSEDLLADTIEWKNDYRLNISGDVSENAGVYVRFEPGTIDVDEGVDNPATPDVVEYESKVAVGALVKRANYYVNTSVGKVVVGLQSDDLTGIQYNAFGDLMAATFTGVGFYPTISDDVKAFGFYNPSAKEFGAQAKGSVAGVTVWGGVSKAEAEEDMALSVGGSYALGEAATIYGQFDKQGDADEKYVGANGNAAGIDWVAEYALESKTLGLDFTKAVGSVEFNAGYEKVDEEEGKLYFYTTVNF